MTLARFLKAVPVRAVWCQIFDEPAQIWSPVRLSLSNELGLHAQAIVVIFARRWSMGPLFHTLKRWWGCKDLAQQSRGVLALGTLMLALQLHASFPMRDIAPWRVGRYIIAGLLMRWLQKTCTGLHFRAAYCEKSRQFQSPNSRECHPLLENAALLG